MKTNDEIRRDNLLIAISRMRTASALAERADVSSAYLSQIKNQTPESKTGKPKNMGDDVARKIETALGEAAGWMDTDHSSEKNDGSIIGKNDPMFAPSQGESSSILKKTTNLSTMDREVGRSNFRRVYVVGRAQGGLPERLWTDGDYPVGATDEYADLATGDPHAFLTPVIGTSMVPRYNPGEFAFVEPGTEPEPGDDVLVRLATGETIIKKLNSQRGGMIELYSYNEREQGPLFYRLEEISWIYYIAHPVPARKIKTRM